MSVINKTIQSNKTYTYTLDSIPDVTTDDWYIKKVNSSNTNFTFKIYANERSFSLTCTNGEETTYSNVEIFITIGFRNTTGPTRTDKTISTIWNIEVYAPRLPFIIKNTKAGQDITFSITKNGNITLDYNYYIGDISDTMPDKSLYTNQTETKTFDIPNGKALYLYSDTMTQLGTADYSDYTNFNSKFDFEIGGSLMGMLKRGSYPYFSGMFKECTGLTSIPENLLPATTLSDRCYRSMFYGCTGLTSIPENLLPATTLASNCYNYMFYGCTGLTSIPENLLPATTLESSCYNYMFSGCTGLTSIPENLLPATTLAFSCYEGMFRECTGLTSIPENLLPATTLASNCYEGMFYGCTGLTSIPENLLPATTLASSCYNYMFSGCTGLTSIPENLLPATTLASSCYNYMFSGCTGLTSIPENLLPATTLASNCYEGMFYGCTGLTSIPENLLPATTLSGRCYGSMFRECTGLTSIPENLLPATTLSDRCYRYMFYGCNKLIKAPNLPATKLANGCYGYMFRGCTKLNYVKVMALDPLDSIKSDSWLSNVSATGTAVVNANAAWVSGMTRGVNTIPEGWTIVTATD